MQKISELNDTAYLLAVYASRRQLPDAAQDSPPAHLAWCWLGRTLTCWVAYASSSSVFSPHIPKRQASPGAMKSISTSTKRIRKSPDSTTYWI